MLVNLVLIFMLLVSTAYAGDYGRKSSLQGVSALQEAQDRDIKLIQEFTKDLSAETKAAAIKTYYSKKTARDRANRELPGSSMQEYVERMQRLTKILDGTALSADEKGGMIVAFEDCYMFTGMNILKAEAVFARIVKDASIVDNAQRAALLKKELVGE